MPPYLGVVDDCQQNENNYSLYGMLAGLGLGVKQCDLIPSVNTGYSASIGQAYFTLQCI